MRKIDAIDEAIIESPSTVVFKAFLNEISGATHWWMPYLGFKALDRYLSKKYD
jgi:hypothetical protein